MDLKGKGLLYTRGSVPYYGTYPGLRVPRPLLLVPHENSDSALPKLAEEVLALTKVNWNTTQFDPEASGSYQGCPRSRAHSQAHRIRNTDLARFQKIHLNLNRTNDVLSGPQYVAV